MRVNMIVLMLKKFLECTKIKIIKDLFTFVIEIVIFYLQIGF